MGGVPSATEPSRSPAAPRAARSTRPLQLFAAIAIGSFEVAQGIIVLHEIEMAERVQPMRVKARRNDDQIRPERFDARDNRSVERLAEDFAAIAGAAAALTI